MNSTTVKRAIFIYDLTGIMAAPWLSAGYECWLFDGQHPRGITREGNLVRVGCMLNPVKWEDEAHNVASLVRSADFVFGFPECTDIAVSGAAHFAKKLEANPLCQIWAVDLAKLVAKVGELLNAPYGIENPVSVMSTLWRKPDYMFHPYEYGGYLPVDDTHPLYPDYIAPRDAYPKKTCLWTGNGFVMPPTSPVTPEVGFSRQHRKLGGRSQRTKNIRSATPRGFAEAVFKANRS